MANESTKLFWLLIVFLISSNTLADKYDDMVETVREQTTKQEIQQAGIDELVKRAERGDVWAKNRLAYDYYTGRNAPQNFQEAFRWYTDAAESGSALGQYSLAQMYNNGDGMERSNPVKAHEWYSKAAEQGHADAQAALGYQYEAGSGVAKNRERALLWYTRAAEQGNVYAQNNLGMLYFNCETQKQVVKVYHGDEITFGFGMEKKSGAQLDAEYNAAHPENYLPVRGANWDYQKAYLWFMVAGINRNEQASQALNALNTMLAPAVILEAKKMAAEQQKIISRNLLK